MVTAHPALTASVTLGAFPTLASFAALTMLVTLAMRPALAVRPIQFSLPNFVTPGPGRSPVMVFTPSMLGVFPDGGIIGISLWRGPGLFALFSIKWGGLSFGYCLVETLLVLAVQVPYGCKRQWHQGHHLYWDIVCHPGLSGLVQYLS